MQQAGCDSIVEYILLKVAARCNIACTYCYWFRDPEVYDKPKVMKRDTFDILIARLREHVRTFALKSFAVLFHGGEPLLCKKADIDHFCAALRTIEDEEGCRFHFKLTTNGLLIDAAWIELFKRHHIGVTLSIDGPEDVHDSARVDFQGRGTFRRVLLAIETLRAGGIEPGLLSVCDPASDPGKTLRLIADDLGFTGFDILVPDATHEDAPASISAYYRKLFDLWADEYDGKGVSVRILDNMLLGLLGGYSESESIGFGPIRRLTILTDGSMETLDVLRTIGPGFTRSSLNIRTNRIQDIETDPLWREVLDASLHLPAPCLSCAYKTACGGGHIASRWSDENRFDNPSVYCADIKDVLGHVWGRVKPDLRLVRAERTAV